MEAFEFTYPIKVGIKKPKAEVFKAIQNQEVLCKYFTTESSGPLETGEMVTWTWKCGTSIDVRVLEVEPNSFIGCCWVATGASNEVQFSFRLEEPEPSWTVIHFEEKGWPQTAEGLKESYECCSGWTDMLLSLKAWLEHGIRL